MKSFKQFLKEAKIDTTERDKKIASYLEKNYKLKSKGDISVIIKGSPNDISIRISAGLQPSLSNYFDMVEFNKNIDRFFANENININKLRPFLGMGGAMILKFNVDEPHSIYIDEKYRNKIIKDVGGAKEFNEKYGDKSTRILNDSLDLGNVKVSDIARKGSFDVILPKGKINIPVDKLYWFVINNPSFSFNLKDNYNIVKNSGAAKEISPVKIESFVNDVNRTIDELNNIVNLFEGDQILDSEIKDLSSDLVKQSIKFRKNLKSIVKTRIDELKSEYDSSNEKSVIEAYLNNLKDLLKAL